MAPDSFYRDSLQKVVDPAVPSWPQCVDSDRVLGANAEVSSNVYVGNTMSVSVPVEFSPSSTEKQCVSVYTRVAPKPMHRGTIGYDMSYRKAASEIPSNVSYVWSPEIAGSSLSELSASGLGVPSCSFQESQNNLSAAPFGPFARAETNHLPQMFQRNDFAFCQGMSTAYVGCRSPSLNMSDLDRLNSATSVTQQPVQQLKFASFFDRKSVNELVIAREKVMEKALAGRKSESNEPQQPLDNVISSSTVFSPPQEVSSPPAGVVDIAMLYRKYNSSESTSGGNSDTERTGKGATNQVDDVTCNSQTRKLLRTAAAARLAETNINGKDNKKSTHVIDPRQRDGVFNVVPSRSPRATPTPTFKPSHIPRKIGELSDPAAQEGSSCRLSQRRITVAREVESQDKRTDEPYGLNLHRIAPSGTYTHIIPVTSCGACKGIFRGQLYALGNKDGKSLTTAARVVTLQSERYFVFSIPDPELIPSGDLNLLSCISQGSFGTVFKALWKGSVVAVKQAHGKMSHEAMRSVVREINSYRVIEHPFIVKYFGVCVEENFVALITEYLEGGNLFDILFENRQLLPASSRLKMCRQLLDAVHYLHTQKRLVHRDLKTANLVIDKYHNARLCDFGKTRSMEKNGKLRLEDNGGSPRYMAPECFIEGNYVDHKVDIWGLACCLVELLGGPIPFEEIHSNEGVIQALLHQHRRPIVPAWFHPLVRKTLDQCFAWNPAERPDTDVLLKLFSALSPRELDQYGMNTKRRA